jgi:NADPH:quinone reductase-like Zn-dependent oxidoreductase
LAVWGGGWGQVGAVGGLAEVVGFRRPKDPIGGDVAGVVEAVGKDMTHLRPGDEVYGVRNGAFAEYVAGKYFVPKPANLSFEQAAAVPIAALTALQALRDKGGIQAGQRVLINGAGGGVGTFAVQLAKAFGAEVTATTRTENLELLRSICADHVIDYTREDFTRAGTLYDLIVDVGGRPSLRAMRRALKPAGTFVQVGAAKGGAGVVGRMVAGMLRSKVLKQRVVMFISKASIDDFTTLKELIEAGKIRPVIDRTYPLDQIAEAIAYAATERARGKVVITI